MQSRFDLAVATLVISLASFAYKRVVTELRAGSFKSGAATMVDVAEICKAGFTAQPL